MAQSRGKKTMKKAMLHYHRLYQAGSIDYRLAGSFVEHINQCVYGGLYQPDHPTADTLGFRGDLKEMIRRSGIRLIRYPGGNFVSGYHWTDGIGPKEKRPVRWNAAWNMPETNQVGLDEMVRYLLDVDVELMMAINLGTGTPDEAAALVEYCNFPSGTAWSELRRQNGSPDPYDIHLWCVGNEMDGPWQIGHTDAATYAEKFCQAAQLMRAVDPTIQLVACGSCSNERAHTTFGQWDRIVLERAFDQMDYLSLHRYYGYDVEQNLLYPRLENMEDLAGMPADLEEMLLTIEGAIQLEKGKRHSAKKPKISFDELSVLPHNRISTNGTLVNAYRLVDAALYGALLCTLLCHAEFVKINCQSLIVNENGLFTALPQGTVFPQSILYPFRDIARYANGVALKPVGEVPQTMTPHLGCAPSLYTACTWDEASGKGTLFLANLELENMTELRFQLNGFPGLCFREHWSLSGTSPLEYNTELEPERVHPKADELPLQQNENWQIILPPYSWHTLLFECPIQ